MQQTIDFIQATRLGQNDHLEIELKLLLDRRINTFDFIIKSNRNIKDIIENIKYENPVLTRTINFINTKPDSMFVKQLSYINCVQDTSSKKLYSKKSIIKPVYLVSKEQNLSYKLSVNIETDEVSDDNVFDISRFRLRYSIPLQDWRFDITIVKETRDKSITALRNIKDRLFDQRITADNFMETAEWDYADRVEAELEYTGKIHEFSIEKMASILRLIPADTKTEYIDCICEIAKILKPKLIDKFRSGQFGLKQLGASPVELTKKSFGEIDIADFTVTEKIDGFRSMLIINKQDCYILNNKVESGMTHLIIDCMPDIDRVILDAESVCIGGETRYYVFDIIEYRANADKIMTKENIHLRNFKDRLALLNHVIDLNMTIGGTKFLYHKNFIHLNADYGVQIREFYAEVSKKEYEIDGLIFISNTTEYNAKWKPVMTIDFLAKSCPDKMLGIAPYEVKPGKTLYLLFCGIRAAEYKKLGIEKFRTYELLYKNMSYIPIQFAPSSNPYAYLFWSDNPSLNDKVVELSYTTEWNLFKIRDDRLNDVKRQTYFGNYFKYAENIWMNYFNPLTLDNICSRDSYFKKSGDKCVAVRKFNNYVKKQLIDLNSGQTNLNWVIDLAAGQGQDLNKYIERGFKNILMIDNDRDALSEIINRKYLYINDKSTNNSKIFVKHMDLSGPYSGNIDALYNTFYTIPSSGGQLVTCNFALHYIATNKKAIQNFVKLLDKILAPGGIFMFTAFNGPKIFKLLSEGDWNESSGDFTYSIKKKYTGNFTGESQNIDVMLPFSDNEYYTESLINAETLNAELEKKKIKLIATGGFETYFDKFAKDKSYFSQQLTDTDRKFISLYQYCVYHKNNKRL